MPNLNYFPQLKPIDPVLLAGFFHVIGQSYDEAKRDLLVDVPFVLRYGLPQVEGPPELQRGDTTYTSAQLTAWQNVGTWRNGATFTYAEFVTKYHKNESWFLHDSSGRRLYRTQDSGKRFFYLMHPGNRSFALQWWSDVKAIHQKYGWTHVLVDNVGLDRTKIEETGKASVEFSTDQAYQAAWATFIQVGHEVMGSEVLIVGNCIGDWRATKPITETDLMTTLDGMLFEAFGIGYPNMRPTWTPEDTIRTLQRAQACIQAGKHVLCTLQTVEGDSAAFLAYAYALYLMVAGDTSSVRLVRDVVYGAPPIIIPAMAMDLGKPLGSFSVAGTTLVREFANTIVTVDLKAKTATFAPWRDKPTPDPVADLLRQLQDRVTLVEAQQTRDQELIRALQARLDGATVEVTLTL